MSRQVVHAGCPHRLPTHVTHAGCPRRLPTQVANTGSPCKLSRQVAHEGYPRRLPRRVANVLSRQVFFNASCRRRAAVLQRFRRASVLPRCRVAALPRYLASALPRFRASALPRFRTSALPRCRAAALQRFRTPALKSIVRSRLYYGVLCFPNPWAGFFVNVACFTGLDSRQHLPEVAYEALASSSLDSHGSVEYGGRAWVGRVCRWNMRW